MAVAALRAGFRLWGEMWLSRSRTGAGTPLFQWQRWVRLWGEAMHTWVVSGKCQEVPLGIPMAARSQALLMNGIPSASNKHCGV